MSLRALVDARPVFWAMLAIPAAHILYRWFAEAPLPDELVAPSGEWAARYIILALMMTPLRLLLPRATVIAWLARRRRALGVAAFLYSLLHLAFYLAEMETLRNIVAEFWLLGIWTGWAALLLMVPLALTSNDAAVRALGTAWQGLHRLAYPASLLTLVHWIVVHNEPGEALIHFAPLAILEAYRLVRRARRVAPPSPQHSPGQ